MQQIPQGKSPTHSCHVGLMLLVPGGYKWVLTGIDTYSGMSFAYPRVDANVQCTIKGPEQKILYQRPWRHISSDQGTLSSSEQKYDRKLKRAIEIFVV